MSLSESIYTCLRSICYAYAIQSVVAFVKFSTDYIGHLAFVLPQNVAALPFETFIISPQGGRLLRNPFRRLRIDQPGILRIYYPHIKLICALKDVLSAHASVAL